MMPVLPRILFVAAVLFGSVFPTSARAQEPTAAMQPVQPIQTIHVEVDVDGVPLDQREPFVEALSLQLPAFIDARGLTAQEPAVAELSVRITLRKPDPEREILATLLVLTTRDGQASELELDVCFRCAPGAVIRGALASIPRALPASRLAPEPQDEIEEDPDWSAPSRPERRRSVHFGPRGIAGLASLGVGLGATIGGVVLINRGITRTADGEFLQVMDYKTPGNALAIAGLSAAVVGGVLLTLDLTKLMGERGGTHRAQVALSPVVVGPIGLQLCGRF